MPFKSDKQKKYLIKSKPNVAKKFEKDESSIAKALRTSSRKPNYNRFISKLRGDDKSPIPDDINEKFKVAISNQINKKRA